MSVYSYESFLKNKSEKPETAKKSKFQKVGYFKLDNDGDTAVVRFAYSTPKEFMLADVHTVEVDGRYKRVVCLREDGNEPISNCPLCEAGEKLSKKFYVKLIEYTKDEQGNVVATPKVWERPRAFADDLASKFEEYGEPLSNHIFKIKRRGAKGDMKTTYDVNYANPELYKESVGYVKDFSAFDNFDLSKHSFYVKTYEEIAEFLKTGKFPDTVKEVDEESKNLEKVFTTPAQEAKAEADLGFVPQQPTPATTPSVNPYTTNFGQTSQQSDPTFNRPRRTPQSDIYR